MRTTEFASAHTPKVRRMPHSPQRHLRPRHGEARELLLRKIMSTNTLLIIVLIVLLLGGGGLFYRRR